TARATGTLRAQVVAEAVAWRLGRGCGFATLIEGFHGHLAVILVVCPSGRRYSPRKRVRVKPPRVQIPPPPHRDPRPSRTGIFSLPPSCPYTLRVPKPSATRLGVIPLFPAWKAPLARGEVPVSPRTL